MVIAGDPGETSSNYEVRRLFGSADAARRAVTEGTPRSPTKVRLPHTRVAFVQQQAV